MKKLSIFLLGALAFAATSCEDGPSEVPVQSNPQGPVLEVDGVYAEQNPLAATVDLKTLAEAGDSIPMANVTLTNFPEGYSLKLVAQLSKSDNFSTYGELPLDTRDNIVWANPDDLENVYVTKISKSPAAKDIYVRYEAYAVKDAEELRIGGVDHYIGPFVMNVTPFPSDLVLENAYYLIGTVNGWSVPNALKMSHDGDNAYDNPVFSIIVDITEDQANEGWWWKIIPQSTVEAGDWVDADYAQYGTEEDGDESLEGILIPMLIDEATGEKTSDPQAGKITDLYGTVMLTIDMIEGTYSFQLAIPELYVQGDAAGWNWDSPLVAVLATDDYANYYGASVCAPGGYKFTSEKSWDAVYNLGMGDASTPAEGWTLAGTLLNGSPNNIIPESKGLYWHHVNINTLTFESIYCASIGVVGDATPGGWDASTDLTPSEDFLVWEGDVNFNATGSYKVRANNQWAFSLGGDLNNLNWNNGDNIPTPGEGVKHVKLDLSAHPYTLTVQ